MRAYCTHPIKSPGSWAKLGQRLFTAVALLASLTAGFACGEEEDAGMPMVTEPKRKSEAAGPEVAEGQNSQQVFTYNAVGKRDPFRNYFAELQEEETDRRKLTELQTFDLDQLKLSAVVTGTATPMAMVEDPNGKGHTVKVGTLIGKHWGQVKHIRRGEIIIQEEFRDFSGRRVTNLVPIKLPEEEELKLR